MSYPLIKEGLDSDELRSLAKQQKDGRARLRFLAMALIRDGELCIEVSRVPGVSKESIRRWLKRYRQEGPEGLLPRKPPGRRSKLTEGEIGQLGEMLHSPPVDEVNWTLKSLCAVIESSFGKSYSIGGLGKLLHRIGYRKLTVRPRHSKADVVAQEEFKKNA